MKNFLCVKCMCDLTEHHLILQRDRDLPKCFILSVHLNPLPFWERLKLGILYILGSTSAYGHYDELLLDEPQVGEIVELFKEEVS